MVQLARVRRRTRGERWRAETPPSAGARRVVSADRAGGTFGSVALVIRKIELRRKFQ